MAEYLSSTELSEIEQNLYEELKQLKTADTELNKKLIELKNLYDQYSIVSEASSYHDKRRFGFLQNMASSEYKILQRAKIEQQQIQVIDQLYDLVIEITSLLTQKEEPLDYAIYFTDKDGKVYRSQQNKLSLDYLNISKSNQSMRLSASAFKKFALEQRQAVDITEHYSVFMGVLQKTYNGQSKLPNSKINAGVIAEAFERHLQKVHALALKDGNISVEVGYDWSVDEAWRLVRQSLGNDPWYTGGDVGMTQVKNIGKGNVRLTQFNTIEDIVNFLLYLGNNQFDDNVLKQQAKEAAKVLYNEANDVLNDGVEMTMQEILDELNNRI